MTNSKKSYHHGDLRASLEDAAANIIYESGIDGLSMRKLADRVGVSRSAPYHHFSDKRELLCALANRGFELQGAAAAESEEDAGMSFHERIRLFVRRYVSWAVEYPQYYDLMFGRDIWKSGEVPEEFLNNAHRYFRSYVEKIQCWQGSGDLSGGIDALRFSQVTWGTMHGLSRLMIDGIYVDQKALDVMCDTAVTMFFSTANSQAEPNPNS